MIPCYCLLERRVQKQLPPLYRRATLQDLSEPLQQNVLRWLRKPQRGLLISGPAGTGKTHMAATIVRESIKRAQNAVFQRAAELYAALRGCYAGAQFESQVLVPLVKASLLTLDDLGAGSLSDHERRYALEILDCRANGEMPTVVTTNWSLPQISERIDDRIASRLAAFTYLQMTGADRRLTNKNENEGST